jgi:predicted transcriptional regulator
MKKQAVLELLRHLPDDLDPEELHERLYVLQKIEEGQAALDAGDVLTEEEVEALLEEWPD